MLHDRCVCACVLSLSLSLSGLDRVRYVLDVSTCYYLAASWLPEA